MSNSIDEAIVDLEEAIQTFKIYPSVTTLDDVYRATTAIESTCKNILKTVPQGDRQ